LTTARQSVCSPILFPPSFSLMHATYLRPFRKSLTFNPWYECCSTSIFVLHAVRHLESFVLRSRHLFLFARPCSSNEAMWSVLSRQHQHGVRWLHTGASRCGRQANYLSCINNSFLNVVYFTYLGERRGADMSIAFIETTRLLVLRNLRAMRRLVPCYTYCIIQTYFYFHFHFYLHDYVYYS
jgi:hypothetical protein